MIAVAMAPACSLWAGESKSETEAGDYRPTCQLACDTMAACATAAGDARGFSAANCEAYCVVHVDSSRDPSSWRPIAPSFASYIYLSYVTAESRMCSDFGNRLNLKASDVHSWRSRFGDGLAACEAHTMSNCGVAQKDAEATCVFEQGMFYGVDGLADCVTDDKSCEAAAQCRKDRAREAGWVEEDKPWWGAPP